MVCKCGKELSLKNKSGLCRSCAARLASEKKEPRRKEGEVWKRACDDYYSIKIDGKIRPYHRWLMEQKLGRKLKRNESVHHIDFDKSNNVIENLLLLTISEHMSLHQKKYNQLGEWVKKNGPVNKGERGKQVAWNKGKKTGPLSEETREKLRQASIKARKEKFWSTSKK